MENFQQEILEKINNITKKSRERKKNCEDFIYLLQEKAYIEEVHAENLHKLNKLTSRFLSRTDGMLNESLSSFQSFQTIEYHQTIEVIESIRNEMIPTINSLLDSQNGQESKLIFEVKTKNKKLVDQYDKITKLKEKIWDNHNETSERKKEEWETKSKDQFNNFKNVFDEYMQNLENLNKFFYEQDDQRLEMIKNSLTKYFIYEISRIRNLQYDSEKIARKLEAFSLKNENFFQKNQEISLINDSLKFSFEKLSNLFTINMNINIAKNKQFQTNNTNNEPFSDTWKNLLGKWNDYKNNFLTNKNDKEKTSSFAFLDFYFGYSLKGEEPNKDMELNLQNLLKDPNSQESLCYFFDNFRNTIKNPLSDTHFDVLCKILLKIINPLIDRNQIDTLKKALLFSKGLYKIQKTFEIKNRAVIPKQEEKIFIFTEIKNNISYTQTPYWIQLANDRMSIVLEKYLTFIKENNDEKHNEIFIESFKSLILNQLRYVHKEMTFVSFSKSQIYEIFKITEEFVEKENSDLAKIMNAIILENFNFHCENKENNMPNLGTKKKIFDENKQNPINFVSADIMKIKPSEIEPLDLLNI